MYGVNGEALQLHTVNKKPIFYYKSCENPYQILQVMCNKIEGLYDKIIYHHSTNLYQKKISLVCTIGIVTRAAHS